MLQRLQQRVLKKKVNATNSVIVMAEKDEYSMDDFVLPDFRLDDFSTDESSTGY
jgi:hypothetical protein